MSGGINHQGTKKAQPEELFLVKLAPWPVASRSLIRDSSIKIFGMTLSFWVSELRLT